MKTLETMTRDEKSLLLFFETRAVDYSGRVQTEHMNAEDRKIAEQWNTEGFVRYGRICAEDLSEYGTHWCSLSAEACGLAHAERRERARRLWFTREWRTAEEKAAGSVVEQRKLAMEKQP
jgi:hypothetical protein